MILFSLHSVLCQYVSQFSDVLSEKGFPFIVLNILHIIFFTALLLLDHENEQIINPYSIYLRIYCP